LAVRVIVDILGKLSVDWVILDRDVNGDARLEINDVRFKCLDLLLLISDALKQLK